MGVLVQQPQREPGSRRDGLDDRGMTTIALPQPDLDENTLPAAAEPEITDEPTDAELAEAEELDLDFDEDARSLDSMKQLIAGLDLEPQLTAPEQVRLGREKQLYAGLREEVRTILRDRGITDRDFDEELYWQLVNALPFEQRRLIPASEQAFWRMYRANLRLVFWVAKNTGPRETRDERFQEGCIGLIRAVVKFDPERGHRFSTYAGWWIRNEIRSAYRRSRFVRLPEHVERKLRDLEAARQKFINTHNRTPNERELAKAAKLTVPELRKLADYDVQIASLHSSMGDDEDAGSLVDMIASSDERDDPASSTIAAFSCGAIFELVSTVLTPAEQKVLMRREGINGPDERTHTGQIPLEQIASELGTSRERIRTLLEAAYAKLAAAAAAADLR